MLRKALFILSGNAAASLLSLLRNILVARLLSVEDYGIAATFAIVMTVAEMMSSLGMQQQIVQSKAGDDPRFQASLQGFNILRGLLAGLVLFLTAGWIAAFLGVPEIAWAYQLVAIIPVLNGLQHFDIHRLNRQMRYGPVIATQTLPVLISLLALWPAMLIWGDFRVMLAAMLIQFTLMAVISQLLAERRFQIGFDRRVIGGAVSFGWPLLVNNLLLFAVFHGEKLIVGRVAGLELLAILAMGLTLTLTPTLVMARSAQNFLLPQLSAAQDEDARFHRLGRITLQVALLNGAILVLAVLWLGGPFVRFALGEKYAALVPLMGWLAIMNAARVFKAGGAVVSLARGATGNAMIANLFRVATLPLSWVVLSRGGDLLDVILIATAGEFCGVLASYILVRRRAHLPLAPLRWSFLAIALFLALAALATAWPSLPADLAAAVPQWLLMIAATLAFGGSVWTMTECRQYVLARLRRRPQPQKRV